MLMAPFPALVASKEVVVVGWLSIIQHRVERRALKAKPLILWPSRRLARTMRPQSMDLESARHVYADGYREGEDGK
jgi:hypothetical protein